MLVALLAIAASSAGAGALQKVRVEVVGGVEGESVRIYADTTWLGEDRSLALTDDGSTPGDTPHDGVVSGEWTGAPVRVLPIRLTYAPSGADGEEETRVDIAAFLEPVDVSEDRLVYAIDWGAPPTARRVAAALPPRAMNVADTAGVAAALGWTGLVLAYVAWLVRRAVPE